MTEQKYRNDCSVTRDDSLSVDPNDAWQTRVVVTLRAGDRALFRRLRATHNFSQQDIYLIKDVLSDLLYAAGAKP